MRMNDLPSEIGYLPLRMLFSAFFLIFIYYESPEDPDAFDENQTACLLPSADHCSASRVFYSTTVGG